MRLILLTMLLVACGAPDRMDCGQDGGWEWGRISEPDGGTRVVGCP
jgi:hypothetical protein